MKIFVFAYNRFNNTTTSSMLEESNLDHIVLCHSAEDRDRFIAGGLVAEKRIFATGESKGLANNRNAALSMMEDDEWALFLVDDIKQLTEYSDYDTSSTDTLGVNISNVPVFRKKLAHAIDFSVLLKRTESSIKYVEFLGGALLGYAGNTNPLFRNKKYVHNVLADGRAWAVKKTKLRFDARTQLIDDVSWTAANIQEHGIVVVNQWVLPEAARYTSGGYGSIQDRMPQKLEEAKYLVTKYPHLVAYRAKSGWPARSHVVIKSRRPMKIKD